MNTHSVSIRALMALCLSLVLSLSAASALAQDEGGGEDGDKGMDFTEEGEGEGEGGGEDMMDFTDDEADAALPKDGLIVTGVILRADPDVNLTVTQNMSDVLMAELDKLEGYQNIANAELLAKFAGLGEQGAQDCLYNPICLSRLGKESGLQRMVVGRLGGYSGEYTLNMDLINIEEGTVEEYVSRTIKGDDDDLKEIIISTVPRLFKIRVAKGDGGEGAPPAEIGPVQKALAWSTAGLGVVSLGLGIFFGLDASGIESDLEEGPRVTNGGQSVLALSQVEAQKMVDDAESSALLANVFYGVGIAAGLTSALLFFITPGSDIATEEELAGPRDFNIAPLIGPDSAGVSAGFTW